MNETIVMVTMVKKEESNRKASCRSRERWMMREASEETVD